MTLAEDLNLPANLLELRKLAPAEEVFLAILREALYPIPVHVNIEAVPELPFVLVRRLNSSGFWRGDPRGLIDVARIATHVYCEGPNGEQAAQVLSEVIRSVLFEAWQDQWTDPEVGGLNRIRMTEEPTRAPDWATSTGPVQYADLPEGTWRYETRYEARVRPPVRS